MKRRPLVFSFVREQALFLTALLALLTFLATLALGVTIGIGAGVGKWNSRWDRFATIQVLPGGDFDAAQRLSLTALRHKIVPDEEIAKMLRPWLGESSALSAYLPKMIEVEFARKSDLRAFGERAANLPGARFITHGAGAKNITRAGWQIMGISVAVMLMILGAIGICISYIARNIMAIHKRELEILTQIGASDSFAARQVRIIVTKISAAAGCIGLLVAAPMILLIVSMAQGTRIGLMAQMHVPASGWLAICLLPVVVVALTAWLARRTTIIMLNK
jgi:cell division transport system permease protein